MGRGCWPSALRGYSSPIIPYGSLLCEVLRDPQCASAQRKRFRIIMLSVSGGLKSSFLQISKLRDHRKTSRHISFSPSAWIETILCMHQDIPILCPVFEPQPNRMRGSREINDRSTIYSTFVWAVVAGQVPCAGIPLRTYHTVACSARC